MTDRLPVASLFSPLAEKELTSMPMPAKSLAQGSEKVIMPVPDSATPISRIRHPKYGTPSQVYPWYIGEGLIAFCTLRFEWEEGGARQKAVLPLTYWEVAPATCQWKFKAPPANRPLLDQHLIATQPEKAVLFGEGEKTAQAAAILFPDMVATTTMGGSNAAHLSDFSCLAGRTVVVAPDLDEPGEKYASAVTSQVRSAGAEAVMRLRCDFIARYVVVDGEPVERMGEIKPGWDLADAVDEGWTADLIKKTFGDSIFVPLTANDNKREPEDAVPNLLFRTTDKALQRRFEDKEGNSYWEDVSTPITVTGLARDAHGRDWKIVLVMQDPDGKEHRLLIPFSELTNDAGPAIARLASLGLKFDPTTRATFERRESRGIP